MTKEEFLNKLKKKISMLEQSEIDDIISEYEGFIDEKMASGMSEKEAVKSLGNIDEIAKDLKSAYKINSEYSQSNAKNIIDTAIEKMMDGIDIVIKSFEGKDAGDVIKMIIKVFLLIILIRICKFPVDVLLDIAEETFMLLGNALGNFLTYVFSFIVNLVYFVLAVMFFYKVFVDKIIGQDVIEEVKEEQEKKKKNDKEEKKVSENKKDEEVLKAPIKQTTEKKGFFDICSEIVLVFIKFIVFFLAFADIFFIVGIASASAVCVYLIVKGVTYYGPILILFALLTSGIAFLEVFIRFIFNAKQKVIGFLITLIVSLLVGGAGIGVLSLEIADTTIINNLPIEKLDTIKEEYDMEENLVISDYLFTDYEVDETLEDKIRIEYSYYNDYFEFKPQTYVNYSTNFKIYHMNYSGSWNANSFKNLIRDLKKKEIYNISDIVRVKVITSSENIKQLEKNHDEYMTRSSDEMIKVDLDDLDEDDIYSYR